MRVESPPQKTQQDSRRNARRRRPLRTLGARAVKSDLVARIDKRLFFV